MKTLFTEAFGYAAASACALLADMAILFVLVHYLSWWYLAAATASFTAGVLVAYSLSVRIVFKQRRLRNRPVEFAAFAAIGGAGLVLNALVMVIGVRVLGLHYMVAKCIAAGFTFLGNFISRRQLLFVTSGSA